MGYYATGSAASGPAAYISLIEAGLTNQGWTLYDSNGGNRVWKSPDLINGSGVGFFIVLSSTAGSLGYSVCIDWDPTTHTAILQSNNAAAGGGSTPSGTYFLYANALGFTFYVDASPFTVLWAGQPRTRQLQGSTDGLCLSTAAMAIGATSVTVNVDLRNRLYVGQKLCIQNYAHNSASANKNNTEWVTVTAVTATTLSFSATTLAYDSGAKIGSPDMLWPIGGVFAGMEQYGSGYLQPMVQAVSQKASGATAGAGNTIFVSAGIATASMEASLNASATAGRAAESFVPLACSTVAGDTGYGQALWGWFMGCVAQVGGSPPRGTKYTDGVNVFVQTNTQIPTGGPKVLFGPTGEAPNFSTMTRIMPPTITVSDSFYMFVQAQPIVPSQKFNRGLN